MDEFLWNVKNGDVEAVNSNIKKGADVNAELTGGRCAIHYAADYGQTDVIERLIEAGADINKEDRNGMTPLLAAIYENHVETVKLLIKKGAKKDGKAPDGKSYFDSAESEEMQRELR